MIKHDGDADNVEENADLDIFIINTDLDTISSSAGLDRFEYAEIPADPGEIFYIIVDDYRGIPQLRLIIRNTPSSSNPNILTKLNESNADINIGKLLVGKTELFEDNSSNTNLRNEITTRMDGRLKN